MNSFAEFETAVLPLLRCPACRSSDRLRVQAGVPRTPLTLAWHSNYLVCNSCAAQYPVTEDLIPVLFIPDLQVSVAGGGSETNLLANIAIYDEISDQYQAHTRTDSVIARRMRCAATKVFRGSAMPRTTDSPSIHLDWGCGPGHVLGWLKSLGFTQIGMDVSLKNLRNARKATGCFVICADACRMPFADDSVDLVTESSVLHHVEDWQSAVSESARVCRLSGRVVLDSEPSTEQMAWSQLAIKVFDLRFPVYRLLSYVVANKYIFRDTNQAKLNLVAEVHHQPGRGISVDELQSIFRERGFAASVVRSPTPELVTVAKPGWKSIALNLLSVRNPWNPDYGAFTVIAYGD